MITSVEAVYRDGKVELLGDAPERAEASRVVVTFLSPERSADELVAHGYTREEAANLRMRFGAIAEDWDHPDMDVYDEP
jgi:hypothetical protein